MPGDGDATTQILIRMSSRAENIVEAISEVRGIFHVCGEDQTGRFGFAQEIMALYTRRAAARGLPPLRMKRLIPVRSEEFPAPAPRPHFSVLSGEKMLKVFGIKLPSWREQLASAFDEMLAGGLSRRE